MILKLLLTLLLFLNLSVIGRSAKVIKTQFENDTIGLNYLVYHQKIYQAEKKFMALQLDESLTDYDELFRIYQFVFAKDVVIALQISALAKNKEKFERFLVIAMESGINIECILDIKIISDFGLSNNLIPVDSEFYSNAKQKYLRTINIELRKKYIELYRLDQSTKTTDEKLFAESIHIHNKALKRDIKQFGFPGEKLVGIDDRADIKGRDDCQISNEFVLIPIYHNPCGYTSLAPFLKLEIERGNLHPKDAGYILEYEKELNKNNHNILRHHCTNKLSDDQRIYIDWFRAIDSTILNKVNVTRKQYCIPTFEHDLSKKEFEEKYKMRLFFGFGIGYFGGHR